MSDVWQPGQEREGKPWSAPTGSGSEGVAVNLAFSADRLVKTAMALLQEQPGLLFLAALNLFVVAVVPQLVSPILQVTLTASLQGSDVPAEVIEGASQLVGVVISLALAPFQLLIGAGAMVAAVRWVQEDELDYGALYTSVVPALRVFVASLLLGLVLFAAYMVVGAVFGAVGYAAYLVGGSFAAIGVVGLGALVLIPALIYVSLGTVLLPYAACFSEEGPVAALSASWRLSEGARSTLFVSALIFGVLQFVGACFCFLPGSLVLAGQYAAFSVAWLRVVLPESQTSQWAFFKRHPEL
jgi:hypothetical protein